MTFGKAVYFNALQTSRIIHHLSNDVFISNIIIKTQHERIATLPLTERPLLLI